MAARRACGVGAVERRQRQAGLDLALHAGVGLDAGALAAAARRVASSSDAQHLLHGREPDRRVGARQREPRQRRPQDAPQPVVGADLRQVGRAAPSRRPRASADRPARATAALVVGGLDDDDLLVRRAEVEAVFEQRREHRPRAGVAARDQPLGDRFLVGEARLAQLAEQRGENAVVWRLRRTAERRRAATDEASSSQQPAARRAAGPPATPVASTCSSVPSTPSSSCCSCRT